FATGRLRPDVSVLLDRAPTPGPAEAAVPAGDDTTPIPLPGEEHLRVRRLLTRMAAAEPHHYVVVEADGPPDDVAVRVLAALTPVLPASSPGDAAGGHDSPGRATAGVAHRARPGSAAAGAAPDARADTEADVTVRRTSPGSPVSEAVAADVPAEPFTRPVPDAAGGGATTAVVYDSKIATSGAEPAPAQFRHRRRRS
ncbi:MAG TPA: hypothetical protein VFY38_01105, partial [Pseudonocardia sp.]|nr:hypothetical protein [Pseudonocardia sp.]